ncbi:MULTISPECIES: FtsK/SpoIIIE domain-containing protein [unclassified Corynebacterium]|uniref:FtsK/SpoIIIE domain-containing protein n=1 Tax=unclassified Corynebacterium TaxID=2624378 RepID=UPI001651CC92|nr:MULTISPECIES: FtsK/SpoIIIE domain-containing protein [unclassified Corynebacterium]
MRPWAVDEDGRPVIWDPTGVGHVVIAGITRTGKSKGSQSIIAGTLTPWIQYTGIDPSAGLLKPLKVFSERPGDFVLGSDEDFLNRAVALLERLVALMRERIAALGWAEKIEHFSTEMPAVVVVLEEYANLLVMAEASGKDGKKLRSHLVSLVGSLLREGAKVGMDVFTILQRPEAAILHDRAQYSVRITYRQDNADSVKMLLDAPEKEDVSRIVGLRPGRGVLSDNGQGLVWFQTPNPDYSTYVETVRDRIYPGHTPLLEENHE